MAVNALVTGLIVFKIFKVFSEVETSSVEQSVGSTRGDKLQHVIFVIIESGMALFVIQLIRVVFFNLPEDSETLDDVYNFVICIHQMLNVIIRFFFHYFFVFVLIITFITWPGHRTDNHFTAGFNEIIFQ